MSWLSGWFGGSKNAAASAKSESPERADDGCEDVGEVRFQAKGTIHSQKSGSSQGLCFVPVPGRTAGEQTLSLTERIETLDTGRKFSDGRLRVITEGDVMLHAEVNSGLDLQTVPSCGAVLFTTRTPEGAVGRFAFQFATGQRDQQGEISPALLLSHFSVTFNHLVYAAFTKTVIDPRVLKTVDVSSDSQDGPELVLPDASTTGPEVSAEEDFARGEFAMAIEGEDDEDEDYEADAPAARAGMATQGRTAVADKPEYQHHEAAGDLHADDLYTFAEEVSTSGTGKGTNHILLDSATFNRGIVVQTASGSKKGGQSGPTTMQAHSYDANGHFSDAGAATFVFDTPVKHQTALHCEGDRKMAFVDGQTSTSVVQLDMTTGQVAATFQPGDEVPVDAISHPDKFGVKNPALMVCANHMGVFEIDTRIGNTNCAVMDPSKNGIGDYWHAHQRDRKSDRFTCHAMSGEGHLAVGDMKGNIRLFSGPPGAKRPDGKYFPKASKTLIGGAAEPIVHLDITSDGLYIVATLKTHLLVLCTRFMGKKDAYTNGFEERMGDKRPQPLKLSLSPEQAVAMGGRAKVPPFTKATFEANQHGEHWIAASAGPHVVTWNFATVKKAMAQHRAVAADTRNMGATVRQSQISGGPGEMVFFLTDDVVGLQTRAKERKSGKYSVRF